MTHVNALGHGQDLCPDLATNRAKRAEITRILSEAGIGWTGCIDRYMVSDMFLIC